MKRMVRCRSRRGNDRAIRERIPGLAAERRRFGYRCLHRLLGREGVMFNHKMVSRLYREECLQGRSAAAAGGR